MTYLENEKELGSITNSVLLTNLRLIQEFGDTYKHSIFLENISSVQVRYKNNFILLVLGVLLLLGGGYAWVDTYGDTLPILITVLGAVLVILYFLTRKHLITVAPDGGRSIEILVKRLPASTIEKFITEIQRAKLQRVEALRSTR